MPFTSHKGTQQKVTLAYHLLVATPAKMRNQSNVMKTLTHLLDAFPPHVLSLSLGIHHLTL
jgi:hypothetical protein